MDRKKTNISKFCFVCLLFLSPFAVCTIGEVEYCWDGTDDDIESRKNMSCATGDTFLANSIASRIRRGADNETEDQGSTHYCMAFKMETSSKTQNVTVTTFSAIFSCDTGNLCNGKAMLEGYQVTYKGKLGMLYCCDSSNNCNQPSLMMHSEHRHTCFSTRAAGKEVCSSRDVPCVRVTVTHLVESDLRLEQISQEYGCDTKYLCRNITNTAHISCSKNAGTEKNTEAETCCCHLDDCFNPEWLEGGSAVNVQQNPGAPKTIWQRTMLIIIGVALGIIVCAIALFIIIRSRRSKTSGENPRQSQGMKYLSVSHSNSHHGNQDEDDEDNVHILSRS